MDNPKETTAAPAECVFQSKEYWLIVYLVAMGYKIVNIECRQDEKGQHFLVWSFPQEAHEIEKMYNRGESMPVDLHALEDAAKLFKRNLQFYRIR